MPEGPRRVKDRVAVLEAAIAERDPHVPLGHDPAVEVRDPLARLCHRRLLRAVACRSALWTEVTAFVTIRSERSGGATAGQRGGRSRGGGPPGIRGPDRPGRALSSWSPRVGRAVHRRAGSAPTRGPRPRASGTGGEGRTAGRPGVANAAG